MTVKRRSFFLITRKMLDRNKVTTYSNLELLAKQVVEGFITGLHKSPFHGFSVEFAEHRLYNSGESTRHLDWKLFARTDKLFVKRYEEETNLRCRIIIDNSTSMYFPFDAKPSFEKPNKITFSVYAAAAIIEMLGKQRDAVGLTLFSDTIELTTQAKSNTQHKRLLFTYLEKLLDAKAPENQKFTSASESLHLISESIHQRSLVVIFSDMFDMEDNEKIFKSLQHLKHNKHEVILFHILDASKEVEFNYKNRPYKFIDAESGEVLKLNPSDVREVYKKKMDARKQELKVKCGQYQIDFVEVDVNKSFDEVLMPYFLKRQKLY